MLKLYRKRYSLQIEAVGSEAILQILERGETAFLHAYATNTPAITLYESLGFAVRREMIVTVLAGATPQIRDRQPTALRAA
jgi:FR47-like protein